MSRTSHRWHYETCPHCGRQEKVQNRSRRYVAPNDVVVSGSPHYITGYSLGQRSIMTIDGHIFTSAEIKRTTQHRLACARKHSVRAYES